jgi:hypothetical protein
MRRGLSVTGGFYAAKDTNYPFDNRAQSRRYLKSALDPLRDGFGVELIGYDPADVNALTRIIQRLLDVGRTHTAGSGEISIGRGSGVHNG